MPHHFRLCTMPSRRDTIKHRLLYPIRERLTCSEREAVALVVILLVVLTSNIMRIVRAAIPPFDDATYEELDSLFTVLSTRADSTAGLTGLVRPDSIHIGFGARFDTVPIRRDGVEEWVLVDTLEKPTAAFPIAINLADARTLQALPRIGPAMAQRILDHRATHGKFSNPEDLLAIRGIGPRTLEKLIPLIVFEVTPDSTGIP